MKRMRYLILAAILSGGIGLLTSCSESDNPSAPDAQEIRDNRQVLVSHIGNDAKVMADNFSSESFCATYQAYEQLLTLIERDKSFIPNMRTLFSAVAESKSILTLYPVKAGSEMAKMGYLAYIIFDNGGLGVQVIFDGKGGSRVLSADHLEFIFPATVNGIGTTLFKLIIRNSDDYYQSVTDANIQNVKRLACVSRLPKSVTMTLNGFIDEREQTLSESVINLELPQKENSEFVSLEASSFKISGRLSAKNDGGDESPLDYSLALDDGMLDFAYGYTHNGRNIVNCETQMEILPQETFIHQMSENAFNVADLKAFAIHILNDLTITGQVSDGVSFAQEFAQVIKDRQQASSADVLAQTVESLNQSCRLQISCEQMTKPETMKFCLVNEGDQCKMEFALKDLDSDRFIPLSQLVDQQVMDNIEESFNLSYTPAGNSAGSIIQFYSVFMQMMPIKY